MLVHIGRSVGNALRAVTETADVAKKLLHATRAELHAAVDARCDELGESIDSGLARKIASLELELVTVEAALVQWRSATGPVVEATRSMPDAEFDAQHDALALRVDAAVECLQGLPVRVIEPPFLGLSRDMPALFSSISGFGRVLDPRPVSTSNLSVEEAPAPRRVCPGGTLQLRLVLGPGHASHSPDEQAVLLGLLIGDVGVAASLNWSGEADGPLLVTLLADPVHSCLLVSARAPVASVIGIYIQVNFSCSTRLDAISYAVR